MDHRPDILVLGGGGVAGINWLSGVLAGIEDASGFKFAESEYFVGTSAGSIVSARLAGGVALRRPTETVVTDASAPESNAFTSWALALSAPVASIGLRLAERPGAVARRAGLRLMPAPSSQLGELEDVGGSWDGRLRVVAVERHSGKRVVFGSPGAPDASVLQAVRASCSIPWAFPATEIAGVEYVDGGMWSPTSIDIAPASQGTRVLCLCPTGSSFGALPLAMRAGSRAAVFVEASAIRARGARVQLVFPDRSSAETMGRDLMADEPAARVHAAGYQQGLVL
jgi:NTE family protein